MSYIVLQPDAQNTPFEKRDIYLALRPRVIMGPTQLYTADLQDCAEWTAFLERTREVLHRRADAGTLIPRTKKDSSIHTYDTLHSV